MVLDLLVVIVLNPTLMALIPVVKLIIDVQLTYSQTFQVKIIMDQANSTLSILKTNLLSKFRSSRTKKVNLLNIQPL